MDQTLVNSLHGVLNCEIGALDCHVITIQHRHVSIVYTCNAYCVMHWSMYFFREGLVNVLIQYKTTMYLQECSNPFLKVKSELNKAVNVSFSRKHRDVGCLTLARTTRLTCQPLSHTFVLPGFRKKKYVDIKNVLVCVCSYWKTQFTTQYTASSIAQWQSAGFECGGSQVQSPVKDRVIPKTL